MQQAAQNPMHKERGIYQAVHLSKRFKSKLAVNDVSFTLNNGLHGLLGPNGAGKTTLMRMMVGVLNPDSGMVRYQGRNILSMSEQYRDILGYLPQHLQMYGDFTVNKFLRYVAELKGIEAGAQHERVEHCTELTGLATQQKVRIRKLSGGMQRRLGIAQALLNDPQVLVLDEPTAGLDPSERARMRNYLQTIAVDRVVLLSTHIVSDLESACDSILLMDDGNLVAHQTPSELIKSVAGLVYLLECDDDQLGYYTREYQVIGTQRVGEKNQLRLLTDTPPDGAVAAAPTLEDVYMDHFSKRGIFG